jgi:cytidyltransferase-like protein
MKQALFYVHEDDIPKKTTENEGFSKNIVQTHDLCPDNKLENTFITDKEYTDSNKTSTIACVSGYFDPIHIGHIEYFKMSKNIADKLMVIVNNDEQAVLKKGKPFMPVDERIKIIQELRCVDYVIKSVDLDRTVCKTLETVSPRPTYFCNGGDQNNNSIPEAKICEELGIILRDGFGDKIQSSSWLVKKIKE